ncbi:MAG: cyclic nucleotide-binding domain-containing protein [Treponema sp.]|nr:cyclic nucleotide-binding domain-containing protein [Treponema sp.]
MPGNASEYIRNFFKLNDSPEDTAMAKKLEASLVQVEYANDEIICRIGDKADAMYFIASGKVEVLDCNNQPLNEVGEGQYFGEYAVMTGDKRLSTVRSKGGTVLFRLESKAVHEGLSYQPSIYGALIKKMYNQIAKKHSQLLLVSSSRRGLAKDVKNQRIMGRKELLIHYGIILLVFLVAAFLPDAENPAPAWVLLPIGYLMVSISITKRTLESLVFACLISLLILFKLGFIFSFFEEMVNTAINYNTMEIVLIIFLLGSLSRLLSCSGGINALRRITMERIKTSRGSLLLSLVCIIVIFLDDYLNLIIAGICFMPVNDKKRVSREMATFVMGMSPEAINSLVPISVWGIFLSGIITIHLGESGMPLFCQSIPFNFISILVLVIAFIAAAGKLPLVGALKAAQERVAQGGSLWPPNSEQYFTENEDTTRGNIINLFLPIGVLVLSSIVSGTITNGTFSVNLGYGLLITIGFLFIFYCFQKLMTPEEFFENIVSGAESMFILNVLLVVTLCFSESITQLGLIEWLISAMSFNNGITWLLPPILFLLFTIISMLLGSSWAMYPFGLPIAMQLAAAVDGNIALCVGAICAAGVAGDGLSYYQSGNIFIATVVGCEPTALVNARLPYFIFLTILAAAMYLVAGVLW